MFHDGLPHYFIQGLSSQQMLCLSGFISVPMNFSYLVFNLQLGDRWMACNSDGMNSRLVQGILNRTDAHKNKTLYHQTLFQVCFILLFLLVALRVWRINVLKQLHICSTNGSVGFSSCHHFFQLCRLHLQ